MRSRLVVLATIALLATATIWSGPARADSIVQEALEFTDTTLDYQVQGSGNVDYFVDLSKVSAKFFANHYAVLDARISYDIGAVVNPQCPPNITLRTSDTTKAAGDYIRRSAAPSVGIQRVAIGQPQERSYLLQVRRDGTGVSTSGPCVTLSNLSVPYTLHVKLFQSNPASTGFDATQVHMPSRGDGEPTIAVDRTHGDLVYVSAPVGIPAVLGGQNAGVDFWRSLDGGASWSWSQPAFLDQAGGGDSDVVVGSDGSVWLADLGLVDVYVGRSTDHGATWSASTPGALDSDRQWIATWSPTPGAAPTKVFLYYHDVNADNLPYECISLDGGAVFQPVCNPMVTDPGVLANATGNTIVGPQSFDSTGTVYAAFTSPTAGDPAATFRNIYLARSSDGITFTNRTIATAPAGVDMAGLFPVLAIDRADNLFVVWAERSSPFGPGVIKLAYSTDHGDHWSAPAIVSPTGGSAVLPWAVAGNAGQVDVTWVGSTSASTNDPTADWYQYMAQSTNVLGGGGFKVARVTSQPIRYGTICLAGLNCSVGGDDGRILLDFTSVDVDSAGNARIAFANSGPEGTYGDPSMPYTDVATQTANGGIFR